MGRTNWEFEPGDMIYDTERGLEREVSRCIRDQKERKYYYVLKSDAVRTSGELGHIEPKDEVERRFVYRDEYNENQPSFLGTDAEPRPGPEQRIYEELKDEG